MRFKVVVTATILLMALAHGRGLSQQGNIPPSPRVLIKFQSHGGPCGSVCINEKDLSCCPAFSFYIDGDGTVRYEGLAGVKVRGKKEHTITAKEVEDLIAEFNKIDFFSLRDKYDDRTIDHTNAVTISLTIGERTKSIYIFHGQPEALTKLTRRTIEVSRVNQYTGRP